MVTKWEWVTPPLLSVFPDDSITVVLVVVSALCVCVWGGGGGGGGGEQRESERGRVEKSGNNRGNQREGEEILTTSFLD